MKNILISLAILIVGFGAGYGFGGDSFQGTTNLDRLDLSEGFTLGSGATTLTNLKSGTCTLVSDSSIAATSTGTGTCAITGVAAGDEVFISLATTTTNMNSQYAVVGTVATTDSVTVRLLNLTGAAAVPGSVSGLGSSTQYWVSR